MSDADEAAVDVGAALTQGDDGVWVPAYAQHRPDFERGNVLSLRHGVFSDRAITPVAQRIARLVMTIAPAMAGYPLQVDLYARTYAPLLLIDAQLDAVGVLDDDGAPRESLLKWRSSLVRQAMTQLREMGLSRKAAAELQLDVASAAQAALGAASRAEEASPEMQAFLRVRGMLPDPAAGEGDAGA